MCAILKLQIINVSTIYIYTYSKKAKSFWQSYESVGKIIDKSFIYFIFGENEKCELMCKHRRNSEAMFKPF